jgi:Recombination endonuclease VII
MPYKNIEDARANDRKRSKDSKRKAWNNAWSRNERATNPEFKAKAYAAIAKWEEEHYEERLEYRKKWAKDHRFKNYKDAREYEFAREMKKYGTTVDWYRDRLIEQNGLCAMCGHLSHHHGTIQRLQVDHSHDCCDIKTKSCGKCLRGLLCADCNILLSYLERFLKEAETPLIPTEGTWLYKATQYLTKYKTQETQ